MQAPEWYHRVQGYCNTVHNHSYRYLGLGVRCVVYLLTLPSRSLLFSLQPTNGNPDLHVWCDRGNKTSIPDLSPSTYKAADIDLASATYIASAPGTGYDTIDIPPRAAGGCVKVRMFKYFGSGIGDRNKEWVWYIRDMLNIDIPNTSSRIQ